MCCHAVVVKDNGTSMIFHTHNILTMPAPGVAVGSNLFPSGAALIIRESGEVAAARRIVGDNFDAVEDILPKGAVSVVEQREATPQPFVSVSSVYCDRRPVRTLRYGAFGVPPAQEYV